MSNEKNTLSFCSQIFHDRHQLLDLLRCQHSSRLVEDQDLIVTIQHFQNLCSLLHTNGNILDQCIRIH